MSRSESRPEVLAFLRDIKERPDDDAPRLILADWLEEHGDEHDVARAGLIRAQVEAARLPPYHPRRVELEGIANRLCQEHRAAWLGPLAGAVRRAWFERGLLHVDAHMRHFITRRTAALVGSEAYAWLEHVLIPTLAGPGLAKLTSLPLLQSVIGLEVRPHWRLSSGSSAALASLFRSENVARLVVLRLTTIYHPDEIVAQLAASPLTRLRALSFLSGLLSAGAAATLAQSPCFAQLTKLDFSHGGLGDEHVQALAASPVLQNLTSLSLSYSSARSTSLAQLVNSPVCRNLSRLDLAGSSALGGAGIAPLLLSPRLGTLQALDLSRIAVGQEGARLLAGSPHLSHLTCLRLGGHPHPRGWQSVDDAAVAILSQSAHLTHLTTLDLSHNRLGPAAAESLASSTLTRLTTLNLAGNQIGYRGAVALARSPILSNVFFLDLSGNQVRRSGARALAESPYLEPGVTLRVSGNHLDEADRALLRERFGDRVDLSSSAGYVYPPEQRE